MAEPRPIEDRRPSSPKDRGDAPAVSVVVPAYNSAATIGRTLEALAAQDLDRPYEVIVVDDGSEDDTVAIAERAPGNVTVLRQDHGGPGPARNLGVANARAEAIAFTDSDCFPATDWLRQGLEALYEADLVQGRVLPDPSVARQPFDRSVWVLRSGGLFECASLLVRRELFERVGGFEDWLRARIGKPLAEDVWFGTRARRAGARIAFAPDALVHHAVFRRDPGEYVAERARLAYFPAMVAKMPEMRDDFLYRRWFLTRRSAEFDLAVAGVVAAAVLLALGAGPFAALPLLAAIPYGWAIGSRALRWRRLGPRVAIADLAADALGLVALAWGSVRWRSPVL